MIRLVPDPVVVASAGPLPSATLHETTVLFRHECRNTINDRVRRNNCQEIISGHVVPGAFIRDSLRSAWRTNASAPTVKAKIAEQEVRLLVDSGTGGLLVYRSRQRAGGNNSISIRMLQYPPLRAEGLIKIRGTTELRSDCEHSRSEPYSLNSDRKESSSMWLSRAR